MKNKIMEIILLIVSLIFMIGTLSFLKPCGPAEDGSFMACHWAGQALIGVSVVLLVLSVILLILRSEPMKQGLAIAVIPVGILAAVIPGGLIHLCMMETMRCHAVMRPGAMCFGIVIAVLALIEIFLSVKRAKSEAK